MPGPPLNVESEKFEKIIILMGGVGNIGKTTTATLLANNDKLYLIQCDRICHKFFGNPGSMYKKTVQLTNEEKHNLYNYVYSEIIETIEKSIHKIFIIEGYIILFLINEFSLIHKLSQKYHYLWKINRV